MLNALCELARREQLIGEPEFEMKPVPWLIHLDADGRLLGFESTLYTPLVENPDSKKKKPKEIAKRFLIPRQFNPETGGARTSGAFAYFLVDKAEYVLGVVPDGKGGAAASEKSRNRQQLFLDKLRGCQGTVQSPALAAAIAFLEKVNAEGLPEPLPAKCGPSDLFAFKVEPEYEALLHEESAIRSWWKKVCSKEGNATGSKLTCLVTGLPMEKTELFPMIKRVPGGTTSGAGLVSFNARAFESYGWSTSENAPISGLAAQQASTALNRLLDPAFELADGTRLPKRRIGLAETTVLVYWAGGAGAEEAVDAFGYALEAAEDCGKVPDLVRSIWNGKPLKEFDPTPFYAVTLSGAQGRIIVRDWLETTVAVAQASIASHFEALQLPMLTPPGKDRTLPPALGLPEILQSIVVKGDKKRIPPPLGAELTHAALTGGAYPLTLLYRALERLRAEIHDDSWKAARRRDVIAALAKAFLTRNFKQETHTSMDALNKTPGYLLGRLLACYGEMQRLANLPRRVNATVVDKYYGIFSVSPRPILKAMDALYQSHLRTARKNRSQPWIAGRAENVAANVNRINAHLCAEELGRLSPEMQAQFVLGFHHQNHWLQLNQQQRDEWVTARNYDLTSPETILVHQLATA